jgi:hypothetical protein
MDGRHARSGRAPVSRTARARFRAFVFSCSVLVIGASAAVIALRSPQSSADSAAGDTRPGGIATDAPASSSPGTAGMAQNPALGVGSVPAAPSAPVSAADAKLLFGIGTEAGPARSTLLAQQTPVHMLTSWYNGPSDLTWLAGWRTTVIPQAYSADYALHVIVWSGDATSEATTKYGTACGRPYPLSIGFLSDMQQLAKIFAGSAHGPPLYVTLFTEFQTYPCIENAWSPNAATTAYYLALKDQYTAAEAIFHANAPNAKVSLGWGGWQARTDDPADGGGRSMFAHFADVMKGSDFESFQAMQGDTNVADIENMVQILGAYGPVMLAHYKPGNGSQATYDADMRGLFGASVLPRLVSEGLFAFSFMDDSTMDASGTTYQLVKNAVTQYGKSW